MSKNRKQELQDFLHIAQLATKEAGNNALKRFKQVRSLKVKPGSTDVVTPVDIENERKIVNILRKAFPKHTILSEEQKLAKEWDEFIWWVDPLDGTTSYFFGLPSWGVSVALVHKNQLLVGVMYMPFFEDLYWATENGGAYQNGKKIGVSDITTLKDGLVAINYGYRREMKSGVTRVTLKLADKVSYPLTYRSPVWAQVLVAEGKLTAHIHHMARRFDHAAGALLVSEAGGKVSDIKGKPINWRETKPVHIITSNGRIHSKIISLLS